MDKNSSAKYAMKSNMDVLLQEVLDILEADDGKSFEEKKAAAVRHLQAAAAPSLAETMVDVAKSDVEGAQIKKRFWSFGKIECKDYGIVLREIEDRDREGYLVLQHKYSLAKSMLKEETYCDMVWNEHRGNKTLNLSIEKDGNYVGYCGINNITKKPWEIAIELHPDWTNKGVGRHAIAAMLDAISARLGETEYKIKIDPANYPSQKLFEKLGAVPDCIAELFLHDSEAIERCEDENLHLIDAKLMEVAATFSVAPRKLLSHVLVYKLKWE